MIAEGLLLIASALCFLFSGSGAKGAEFKSLGWESLSEAATDLRISRGLLILGILFSVGVLLA